MSEKKKKTSSKNKNNNSGNEVNQPIEEVKEIVPDKKEVFDDIQIKKEKHTSHVFVHFFLIVVCIISIISFVFIITNQSNSILSLIQSLLLTIFTILFTIVSITYRRNNKSLIFICGILLLSFLLIGIKVPSVTSIGTNTTPNFSGKSITEVLKWADKNKISVTQEYEYSDMIPEYTVISQNIDSGTPLKEVKEITISISDGPNPSKEIMIPSMIGWDGDTVIEFVKKNYLSNVTVEFVESEKPKDTVIEQSATGTFKRDDELNLKFSYGEELGFEEVKLIDFTNKSQFEVEFYMKQNQLSYKIERDFHKKIKKGFAISQNKKAGEMVKIHDEEVIVTISKGPEIKIPDFTDYTMTDIAEWAIKNKVKITFQDQYDDSVEENHIIKANYQKDDTIEQGTVITITLSKGSLKMPKFDSYQEFMEWAGQYNIPYEEVHEFSDSVQAGKVISYSYKTGDAIKNNDTIVVKISDGAKKTVPNVIGLSKSEAISKIEKAGLKYSFVYRNSTKSKDTVLAQSIQAGSEISSGTTITITLSNGKSESNNNSSNSNSNNNSNNNNNPVTNNDNNNSGNNNNDNTPTCNKCSSIRGSQITSTLQQYSTYESAASGLKSYLQGLCPGLTINITGKKVDGYDPGDYYDGFLGGEVNSCDTISIVLAK